MLTDRELRAAKPAAKLYKLTDQAGMYVAVSPAGTKAFRFDYRLADGRRATLTVGRYDPLLLKQMGPRDPAELKYGDVLSLEDARVLLDRARRSVALGQSPADAKADAKREAKTGTTFESFAAMWLRDSDLADSTRAMRKAVLDRDVTPVLGRRRLRDISSADVMALCDKVKARGAPATALHVRDIIVQVYRHAQARGVKIENPAAAIKTSAIATFRPRDRALSPGEIRRFFTTLETVGTMPTHRLALRFVLLTALRKGELIAARWSWVDFDKATMTIPAEVMKARRTHVVYLSRQSLDLLIGLKTCAGASPFLLPSRYDGELTISAGTLNRVIDVTREKIKDEGGELEPFSVHDLRRTFSTLLHEAGFAADWIEKCLAHEQGGVRAVYNKAEFAEQRREMLQRWANMIDLWIAGSDADPGQAAVITATRQ